MTTNPEPQQPDLIIEAYGTVSPPPDPPDDESDGDDPESDES